MMTQNHESEVDEKHKNNDGVSSLANNFVEHTTSHAITHIFYASGKCLKVFWVVLSVISVGLLCYHLYSIVTKLLKWEVNVQIMERSAANITFPAVTLCNQNFARYSKIDSYISDRISDLGNVSEQQLQETLDIIYSSMQARFAELEYEDREDIGHQLNETILVCSFNGISCSTEDFDVFYNPVYGNCFTFNFISMLSDSDAFIATKSGPRSGLKLLVNVQQEEYVSHLVEAAGVRVLVHERTSMPFPEDEGISIAPNTQANIAIGQTTKNRVVDPRYGKCIQDSASKVNSAAIPNVYKYEFKDIRYSKRACQKTCILKEIVESCLCFPPGIPYNKTIFPDVPVASRPCNVSDDECVDHVNYDFDDGTLKCELCETPCSEKTYQVLATTTAWPSLLYMNELKSVLRDQYNSTYASLQSVANTYGVTIDGAIKYNLLSIKVYYEKMMITEYNETKGYDDFQFIADLGGVFGLWIGWSILTFFEFVVFTFSICGTCCRRNKRHREVDNMK